MKCPECGKKVVYQGVTEIECETFGCPNGPEVPNTWDIREQIDIDWSKLDWKGFYVP
jgi:hypothetical protein